MLLLVTEGKTLFCWNIRTGFFWIVILSMEGTWNITCPKEEGKICIIACKYLFLFTKLTWMVSLMYLKPVVKALRYGRHAFLFSKQKIIYLQKTKDEFSGSYCEKSKNRHLVYEFFDTSRGGYHPKMEPVVNTCIQQKRYKTKVR